MPDLLPVNVQISSAKVRPVSDPLALVVGLLRPRMIVSKLVVAAGAWATHRSDERHPVYCAVLDGTCRVSVGRETPIRLETGDFLLIPALSEVTSSSMAGVPRSEDARRYEITPGLVRLGTAARPDFRMLVGHCAFGSEDAELLLPLLPRLVHVRAEGRLTALVRLLDDEARDDRPGRDMVLARLLEVLLIEALRSTVGGAASPGLLRGLADGRLAAALRQIHAHPTRPWTVAALAREAGLSRSTFFERFRHEVGVSPMEYLLGWRMAIAKDLLSREKRPLAEVAELAGYSSASTFSVAFSRHVGMPPIVYARQRRDAG